MYIGLRRMTTIRSLTAFLVLCCFTLAPISFAQSHRCSYRPHSSKSHNVRKTTRQTGATVHVRGYYRKDGTYVAPHERRTPGPRGTRAFVPYRRNYIAPGYQADASVKRNRHGRIKRSQAAKATFERQSPCPSTGKTRGPCPGYIVDHVQALECGGADAPSNMQWQTVADAKMKDKTEGSCRQ